MTAQEKFLKKKQHMSMNYKPVIDKKQHVLIPALLTAAAAYFAYKGKTEQIADAAKYVINKAIDHQTQSNRDKNKARRRRYKPRKKKVLVFKLKG